MNWTLFAVILVIAFTFLFLRRGCGQTASAETVAALLKQKAKVIDVRTADEYQDGHLAGAINVPLAALGRDIGRMAPDKGQPILLHCASGMRSATGQKTLERLGYTNVHNLGSFSRARTLLNPVP
jgi:phage shock protein E